MIGDKKEENSRTTYYFLLFFLKIRPDYRALRKEADEGYNEILCSGVGWGTSAPTYGKNWREFYSPVPCIRDYYGSPAGVWDDDRWFTVHLYTVANSSMHIGGDELHQLAYEFCSHDYKPNGDYKGAVLEQGMPYSDGGLYRRYMKVDFTKMNNNNNQDAHPTFWNYWAGEDMRKLRKYTDIINYINNFVLGNTTKLEYTDPS